ncbi:MAG: class I SAM-dependent methyltransferase [Nanoarchaeota archaeon]
MTSIKIISKEEFLKKNKKPNQEKVWDNIAKSVEKRDFFKVREINAVNEFLKDKKGLVIDLGCGAGWNMVPSKDILYYGIDSSKESIKLTKKRAEKKDVKARLFKGNATKLDKKIFKDEMFDYGLFIATLHCIEGEKERLNALKEFYRILKKGAEALITIWNSEDERFDNIKNKGDIYMSWKQGKKSFMRYYYLFSEKEFLNLLKSVGFKILEINSKETDRFSKKNWIVRIGKQ